MISVVTITYNNYQQLVDTINSARDCDDIELIIINGGDCKKTLGYLADIEIDGTDITVVSESDRGIADAFSKGVSYAKGEAVTFLNSGDLLLYPAYYQEVDQIFAKSPEISFVHGNIIFKDALCGELLMVPRECNLGRGMPYHHQTMVVRKKIFDQVGAFDIDYKINMDYEFVCRMSKIKAKGFYFKEKPLILMDGDGVSATQESRSLQEAYRALKKNDLFSISIYWGLFRRRFFYHGRQIMLLLGLSALLSSLKKIKNSCLSIWKNV